MQIQDHHELPKPDQRRPPRTIEDRVAIAGQYPKAFRSGASQSGNLGVLKLPDLRTMRAPSTTCLCPADLGTIINIGVNRHMYFNIHLRLVLS